MNIKKLFTLHSSLFTWFSRRRINRRKLRELSQTASVFRTLQRLSDSGILAWDQQQRHLFIDSSLALVMMTNADTWRTFLQNVYLWQYSRLCDQAWAEYMQHEELAAVRAAIGDGSSRDSERSHKNRPLGELSRADIDRIRHARRREIAFSDMEPPKVEPFEFFIIPSSTAPTVEPIAVGHYDPDTESLEMAPWQDVKPLLKKED